MLYINNFTQLNNLRCFKVSEYALINEYFARRLDS